MTNNVPTDQISPEVAAFLASVTTEQATSSHRGAIVFAIDATASRQPTWDMASELTGAMFREVAAIGSLDIQVAYYGGTSGINASCRASGWMSDPLQLAKFMTRVQCHAGQTQIGKIIDHVSGETSQRTINATIFVGDAFEEKLDHLAMRARLLADRKIPIFAFLEGQDLQAEHAFRELARITGGAFSRFDSGSAAQLGALLRAVARFATGGRAALEHHQDSAAKLLLGQLR